MNVSVPDRLPTTLRPLPGTRHVRPTPTAAARLALAKRRQSASARGTPFRAELDLTLGLMGCASVGELSGDMLAVDLAAPRGRGERARPEPGRELPAAGPIPGQASQRSIASLPARTMPMCWLRSRSSSGSGST